MTGPDLSRKALGWRSMRNVPRFSSMTRVSRVTRPNVARAFLVSVDFGTQRSLNMRRGGIRPRYLTAGALVVWCAGRWGRKRVRVTQCWGALTAETVYTRLLRDSTGIRPGARGSLTWTLPGRSVSLDWELRANAVWRFGRAFLRCPRCQLLATRIYVPTADAWAACRRCWGLTYESRQLRNYRGSLSSVWSQRTLAHWSTLSARERRAVAAAERRAERAAILRGSAG